MKIMALDVGRSRIGVALSDPDQVLALPHSTLERTSSNQDITTLLDMAIDNHVQEIVVGLPLSLSGSIGPQAREVNYFVRDLSSVADVPITTLDERYSTVEAERLLRQTGKSPSENRSDVDSIAATIILQTYLDSKKFTLGE